MNSEKNKKLYEKKGKVFFQRCYRKISKENNIIINSTTNKKSCTRKNTIEYYLEALKLEL